MSSKLPSSRRGIRQWLNDTSGNIAFTFGLALIPIAGAAGAGVDFYQASRLSSRLQSATDAAILGAMSARGLTDSEREARAVSYFTANATHIHSLVTSPPTASITGGSGRVEVQANMRTSLLSVIGITELPVSAASVAKASGLKLELSLVTDITGSMGDTIAGVTKINSLKAAAKDLLDIVMPDDNNWAPDVSRVALIPFANYVNAGEHASAVTGLASTRTNSGSTVNLMTCVTERTGREAYTDASPGNSAWIGGVAGGNSINNYSNDGACLRNGSSGSEIPPVMGLTNDKQAIVDVVNGYTAQGSTAGHLGTAWGWYGLSPSWSGIWGGNSVPADYANTDVAKVMVLMTDGQYNTEYSPSSSKTQALALCSSMKEKGITIYTIGFGLNASNSSDRDAISTLQSCASTTDHFHLAADGDALRAAFAQIGQKVSNVKVRLTN